MKTIVLVLLFISGPTVAGSFRVETASVEDGPLAVVKALNQAAQNAERSCGSPIVPVSYGVGPSQLVGSDLRSFLSVEAQFECVDPREPAGYSQAQCGPSCGSHEDCPKGQRCRRTWICFGTCG